MEECEEKDEEVLEDVIILTDEDGHDENFELLGIVDCEDKKYAVLMPVDDNPNGEVEIFRIETDGENETYAGVDSEEEADKVFELFREQAKDRFIFVE